MAQQMVTKNEALVGLRALLEKTKPQIATALPRHITAERVMRVAMTSVQRNPKLLECDPMTVLAAIVQSSELGLEPSSMLGHAYLVPFWNSKRKCRECQLIPGYKGLIELSRRSGQISTIQATLVYEKDEFDFSLGLDPGLTHDPFMDGDRGEIIACYAIAKLKDGGVQFEVMSTHQIEQHRARSASSDSGPWVTDWGWMAKKTVLKQLCKLLPMSIEFQRAASLDDAGEIGIPQEFDFTIEPEALPGADDEPEADQLGGMEAELEQRRETAKQNGNGTKNPVPNEMDALLEEITVADSPEAVDAIYEREQRAGRFLAMELSKIKRACEETKERLAALAGE